MTIKTILLCCIVSFLSSCIGEDLSECPPTVNLQLTFSYMGDTGDPSMFVRCIDQVTLMVYDENEKQVLNKEINKNELTIQQGTELTLAPGNYTIICWGNTREYTQFYQCESFAGGRLHHPDLFNENKVTTNSHLYYGSYEVIVPEQGTVSGDVPFRGAHINVEVYIRGTVSADEPQVLPYIEAHNLMPQYRMDMTAAMPYSTTYYPETTYNAEKELNQSLFQVLNFQDENPVIIEIKDQIEQPGYKIELKKYMADNKISVNGKNEATIPILIEYTDLGIEVKLPEWIVNEVQPGTR